MIFIVINGVWLGKWLTNAYAGTAAHHFSRRGYVITSRDELVLKERTVIIDGPNHSVLQPGDRVYVILFTPVGIELTQSGEYCSTAYLPGKPIDPQKRPAPSLLVFVIWDGDSQQSRYPANRLGMMTGEPSTCAVVTSLAGIEYRDKRPLKQRKAHDPATVV